MMNIRMGLMRKTYPCELMGASIMPDRQAAKACRRVGVNIFGVSLLCVFIGRTRWGGARALAS